MTFARIRLAAAALLFAGWLAWLAAAVWQKDNPDKVSRAQLTAADAVVVADVAAGEDGLPVSKATVALRLSAVGPNPGPAAGTEIVVTNLPSGVVPGKGFPGPGQYLLALARVEAGVYRLAGLPRSPGYEEATPKLPVLYPWTPEIQAQLRKLKYEW